MALEDMEILSLNDQPAATPARVLPHLEDFPSRTADTIRFGDLDPQGHVNNTVFATFFETGRVTLLREPGNALNTPGTTSVLAQLDISFLRELHWPGNVEIGTGIVAVGRSSFTFLQAIFHEGACAATGRATMVLIDAKTRRACPLPEEILARLERLRMREAAP
jgi:acyl-CoA thioester hydrolase